jgi:anaphase-promoting complex subunit 6
MLRLNRADRAKECLLEALALDVKCYEAFELLVGGEMMGIDEGSFFFTLSDLLWF